MIENTSKRDPAVHLLGATSEGPSGYIEGMEAAGQRQVVASSLLPIHGQNADTEFEALGFTFGPAHDDMFREATLPAGWRKDGSDHAMWSYVVDERGIKRVGVFYKAAFYDRRADMHVINVGAAAVGAFLYGENESIPWDSFTESERADALDALRRMVENGNDPVTGHIYADKAKKAASELRRIDAAVAS